MAAIIYVWLAFVVWDVFLLNGTFANSIACPLACSCLGGMVDCIKRGLIEVPKDIPSWVESLELQNNGITVLNPGDFKGLPNLKLLDLSNNDIEFINNTVFNDLPHLQTLKINYNKLTELPIFPPNSSLQTLIGNHNRIISIKPKAMENLPNLRFLDLNYNDVMDIPSGTFPKGSKLQQLFMNNNRIISLEMGCLDNLTSLEWLKMNKNKLMEVNKRVFTNLTNLRNLELMRNKIEVIEGLTFNGLKNLQVLKLKRNSISTLWDGAFWGLEKIQNLQLDHNRITNITKGWLYGLDSLKQLSLANNRIQPLEAQTWDFCKGLHKLDLTNNKITTIAEKSFAKLHHLQDLYLDHNMVSRIDDGAFKDLSALVSLEINDNLISWTIEDVSGVFSGLENLGKLGLKTNQIKTIVGEAFQGLKKLRTLHLEDNAITSVQENSFQPLEDLQELYFNSSNLLCDCHLAWLPQWLSKAGFKNSINAICRHPDQLKGKSIFEVPQKDFICNDLEFPKPKIVEHPQSQIALKSDNITLTCISTITGDKEPHFTWKKDNAMLTNVNIVNTATSDGDVKTYNSKLHLYNVQDRASGKYQCVISSEFGSAYSKKAEIQVHVFPVFKKIPKDVTVRAGRYAKLECSAKGQPKPEIAWQKDGGNDFPAARERRMKVVTNEDTFYIMNVKSEDEGIYSCTATNVAGTIVANVSVSVLETPKFIRHMEEKKLTYEGETTVLECMASGSPKPKLTWRKDGKDLVISERHFFTANNQLLVIVETEKSDAGKYECEMSNTVGKETGFTELSVTNSEGATSGSVFNIDDESTTTGIIIIAVVCCVVGTSLVWVIIIYQTRKRPELYSATPTDETTLPGDLPSSGYASSEKELSYTPIHTYTNYHDYQIKEGNYDRLRANKHTAAIFPSDVDEDDQQQTNGLSSASPENSCGSGNYPASETDTLSSTHSGITSLQTFHPLIVDDTLNYNNITNDRCIHCVKPSSSSTSSIHSIKSIRRPEQTPSSSTYCCKHTPVRTRKHSTESGSEEYCYNISPVHNCHHNQIVPPSYSDCVHTCNNTDCVNLQTFSNGPNVPCQMTSVMASRNNCERKCARPSHTSIPIPMNCRNGEILEDV